MTLWYLASPYTDDDPAVMQARFERVCQAAAVLMQRGMLVFSPIAHCHSINRYGLPPTWDYWKQLDIALLSRCDGLLVLMLDGWKESRGVRAETYYAIEHDMPIEYLEEGIADEAGAA